MRTAWPYKWFTTPWAERRNYGMIRKVKTRNLLLSLCNLNDIFDCPVARHLSRNTWTDPAIEVTVTIHLFTIDNGIHPTILNDTPTHKLDRAKDIRLW